LQWEGKSSFEPSRRCSPSGEEAFTGGESLAINAPSMPSSDGAAEHFTSLETAVSELTVSREEVEEIGQFKKPPGNLLCVGQDHGDILETARLYGWNSQVIFNLTDNQTADFDAPVSAGPAVTVERRYDVIRLEHSLENAPDPRIYLKTVGKILSPTGLLVISTPDISTWDFPLYGQGSELWSVDLPIWFFTQESLKRLLVDCGFKVLKISPFRVLKAPPSCDPAPDMAHPYCGDGAIPPSLGFDPPLTKCSVSTVTRFGPGGRHFRVFARWNERRIPARLRAGQRRAEPETKSTGWRMEVPPCLT